MPKAFKATGRVKLGRQIIEAGELIPAETEKAVLKAMMNEGLAERVTMKAENSETERPGRNPNERPHTGKG